MTLKVKFLKIILGIYQAAISVFSLLPLFMAVYVYFRPASNATYHWPNMVFLLLILVPTIIFCSCNAIRLLLPSRNIFSKWKSLFAISGVFTILWTLLFVYLLVFQPTWGSSNGSDTAVHSPQARQVAPDFTLEDQFGKTISLSDLRGKVILLDFWGVWCGPCRKKLPHTQKIFDQFKNKGLAVIGIHSAFRTEKTADFIAENNYTFPTGIDTGHTAKDYRVTGWPTYYLIDKEGRLAWGPRHAPPSEKLIESLLKD
ncbi:MAG: hypothetical protein BBJ57_01675 [Desulfobacterales bacterium PC51MH44]|nr:MAG: hypothetical protein BBJ57_01675 [Desulfobacterales bacterium PC51MH44]